MIAVILKRKMSFYRKFNNNQPIEPAEQEPEPGPSTSSDVAQYEINKKKWQWAKSIRSKFLKYMKQFTVIGFNSQRYDIPLIRPYLPSSIIKYDQVPKLVIKKEGGYMFISSEKFKCIDILNYLAAGTSLKNFYASYNVSNPKGFFPYEWFDSLEKLDHPSLPETRECFKSILTKEAISEEEFQECKAVWWREGFTTFRDWVRHYNDADVIGFTEAGAKMINHEKDINELDMFKDSVSLPGLTQRYLFKKLPPSDYFVGFGEIHKHLLKQLRGSLTGGPSIIFHRYQERLKTLIKGKYLCKNVIGFDANSLYLFCLGQKMCNGFYSVLEKCNGYQRSTRFSQQAIQWIEYLNQTRNLQIQHGTNGGEVRLGNYVVDGYDRTTKTVYEFHGFHGFHGFHKHSCQTDFDPVKWNKVLEREEELLKLDQVDSIVTITSCEWMQMPESKQWYRKPTNVEGLMMDDILEDIVKDRLFGFVTLDIHVPQELYPRFSEFPPIFKNTEITIDDIGEHMKEYCR